MLYVLLEEEKRDDHLAESLYNREMEHFHYGFDQAVFIKMLETLGPGEYRDRIQKHLEDTSKRMAEVQSIHAALTAKITDHAAHGRAAARMKAKRDAAEAAKK